MRRILMIEDDDTILYGLTELLKEEGFLVDAVRSLRETETINADRYCLILLDLGLPDGDGFTFLARHVSGGNGALGGNSASGAGSLGGNAAYGDAAPPVIILTARDGEADIMKGLDMGADDYVTKPFPTGVLLSRIRAVLRRRGKRPEEERLICGSICLNREKTEVMVDGRKAALTAGEYRLLLYFMENQGRTLTRNTLLAHFWDDGGEYVNDNTLTVTVRRLREKLGKDTGRIIRTVRGIGYRMEACDE